MNSVISYTLRFGLLILIISSPALCQDNTDTSASKKKIVAIVPGAEYEAGWLHRLFFGDHWRGLWTTPIDVEVLDLERFAGGLTPLKRGGGFQTKSLTFKGKDGKEYKFRSINKDPKKVLTKELQESIAADIIQDQISSSNPFSAVIVAPILNAVGVLHAVPQLCVMPEDEKLGEFRKDFGGLFGTLEINPGDEDFEGSTKVISSVKLFKRLEKRYDEHVDSKEFLKARLMDVFFGDWDRHKDQWKWARFEIGGQKFYKPIPNDRDQAFAEFDGVFPKIAESAVLQLNHFGSKYPAMQFMTWSGRFLDRKFLPFLEKGDWDSVTNFVFDKLTDSLIDYSVSRLPSAVYEKAKDELLTKLKSRRDLIKEASQEYYELVNRYVDVYCTSKRELVEVERMDSSRTGVSVYRRDKKTGEKVGGPLRHKIFDNSLTCEIRVYLEGNDDKAVVSGVVTDGPIVRIIGGSGKDELIDSSVVRGDLFGFIPLTVSKSKTFFYDDGKKTILSLGTETKYDNEKVKEPEDSLKKYYNKIKKTLSKDEKEKFEEQIDNLKYEPQQIDRGYLWRSQPLIGYTPDIGIIFGGGPILYKYGFRFSPYQYRMQLLAAYAPKKRGLSGLFLDYKGTFYGLKKNIRAELHLRKSGIEVNNYFGPGNESPFAGSLYDAGYYKIEHEEYLIKPSFDFYAYKNLLANVSFFLKYFVLIADNNIVKSINPDTRKISYLGFNSGLTLDNRNHQSAPDSGYYADVQGYLYPSIFNNPHSFGKVKVDLRYYFPYKTFTRLSLALRAKAEKIWGTYPFYESAFIGGIGSVRGLPSERYSGNASVAGGAELRVKALDVFLLFPEEIGVLAFIESGRVFLSGQRSRKWHTGFGGGLYCSIINKDLTFSLSLGSSEKRIGFYFNSGFTF